MGPGDDAAQRRDRVAAVLAGELSYDEASPEVQDEVRDAWSTRCDDALASLDLRSQFVAEGRTQCAEADPTGQVSVTYLGERHP